MLSFIVGDSELAGRIRAYPWHETALGSPEGWPDSLKTLVSVMLAANQPMYTVWGPSQLLLYNDQYISVLQGHHPSALGQPFLQVWSEIVDDLRPLVENAYAGMPTYMDDILLVLERSGYTEETHFAYSYTPVLNRSGRVDGFFCACIETTGQVKAARVVRESEERQAFLLKLSDTLRAVPEVATLGDLAVQFAAEHLNLDRCYITTYSPGENLWRIIHNVDRREMLPMKLLVRPQDHPEAAEMLDKQTLVFDNVASQPGLSDIDKASFAAMDMNSLISCALRRGENGAIWCLVGVSATPRHWENYEVVLLEEAAERVWAAMERARSEAQLRASEERFRQFANAASDLLWIRKADTFEMEFASKAFESIYGISPDLVMGDVNKCAALVVPDDRKKALEDLSRVREGQSLVHEFRIRRPDDGVFRWVRSTDFPLYDGTEKAVRVAGIARDVTEEKLSAEHQATLLSELQHRVRNILAMVRSVSLRTARGASSVDDFATLLEGRVMSLARTQALLTRAANVSVEIGGLVQAELEAQAHDESQYQLSGPRVEISPKAAEVLSLALHELTTNALKYGALAVSEGRVSVEWTVHEEHASKVLSLRWSETRPPILNWTPPTRRGFGSELVERRVPYELNGRGRVEVTSQGAQVQIEFPLRPGASILETSTPLRKSVHGGSVDMSGEPSLQGHRILIVEDDYLLAYDAESTLTSAGAEVVGPFAEPAPAMEAIRQGGLSAAITDINLGHGPSFELASALRQENVPFVFLTGYDETVIPAEFDGVPRFVKPVDARQLVRELAGFLKVREASGHEKSEPR